MDISQWMNMGGWAIVAMILFLVVGFIFGAMICIPPTLGTVFMVLGVKKKKKSFIITSIIMYCLMVINIILVCLLWK